MEADELGVAGRVLLIVGPRRRHWHRHLDEIAFVVFAEFEVLVRRMFGLRVAGPARGVAVPLLHLGKEPEDVGLRAIAVAGPGQQDAGGQGGVQAQHRRALEHRRRLVGRPQQARGLERAEPALHPLRGVGCQRRQRGGCRGIGQDRGAQLAGVGGLVGDEFVACQRRGRADRIEAERHRQRFEFGDVVVGLLGQELGGQAGRDLVEVGNPVVEQPLCFPVRPHRIQLGAQAFEVVGQPFGQAGVGLQVEAQAHHAAGAHVEGIARGQVEAVGVAGAVEGRPRNVGARQGAGRRAAVGLGVGRRAARHGADRRPADIRRIDDVRQVQAAQHVGAVAHLGGTDRELHVRRVDVGQALQRHAVGAALAGAEVAGAADADAHVVLDRPLDQEALRLHDPLAVGVGDHHVVQAVRRVAQVEDGADVGGVYHLPALGLDLGHAGTGELDQRAGREAGPEDVEADPAVGVVAGAALIGGDAGDLQRQQVGAQGHRRAAGRLARLHEYVVVPGLRAGDQHLLVG